MLFGTVGLLCHPAVAWAGMPSIYLSDLARGINRTPDGFGSPGLSPVRVQFVFADGSVRSLPDDTDPEFVELLSQLEPKK
jgi:hypothetical protein